MSETSQKEASTSIDVKWEFKCHMDCTFGGYIYVWRDTVHPEWGIEKWEECYPRGRDGKGKRESDNHYRVAGWPNKIYKGNEMFAALRQLGHIE
jgi:hypothetical protein